MTAALAKFQGISSVHIVSHGSPGSLHLGNSLLNSDSLTRYRSQLQQWRKALQDNAEILLYGCSVAAGAAGAAFVNQLESVLGATIAASSTPVGNAARGGNWELDVKTGAVAAPLAFQPEVLACYAGVLLDPIVYATCGCAACTMSSLLERGASSTDRAAGTRTVTAAEVVYTNGPTLATTTTEVGLTAAAPETLLFEDFEDASGITPPLGWESVLLAGVPETDIWRFDNPGRRGFLATYLDGTYAVYDSDAISNEDDPNTPEFEGVEESVAFVSPVFDASDASSVVLSFDQVYGGIAAGVNASEIFVEATTDGENWETVYFSNTGDFLINTPIVDLTDQVSGSDSAQVRFRFDGNWAFLWAIDNVSIVSDPAAGVVTPLGTVGVSESNVPDPLDFTFSLESRPTAPVTFNFIVDDAQLQPIEPLTFTAENWYIPQTSVVAAVADEIYEGEDFVSNVRIEVVSDDPNYNGFTVADVPVQITESTIPGYTSYRTVEKTYSDLSALAAANPDLASWVDIGDSYDKTAAGGAPGYDIFAIELGNKSTDKPGFNSGKFGPKGKPVLFIQGAIHAREYTTTEAVTRFAEQLIAGYGTDANITALLDFVDIRVVPIANPDGRKFAEQGYSWRKNTNPGDGTAPFPLYGVDLNRNYDAQWGQVPGGASTDPADLTYQGTGPFSEPESQSLRDYLLNVLPDQKGEDLFDAAPEDAPNIYYDVHSFGNLVLYPFGFDPNPDTQEIELAPNYEGLRNLGLKVGYFTGIDGEAYDVQRALTLYPTSGTTDDWVYETFGNASYTLELGTDFFQDVEYFENIIVPELLPAFFYSGQAAYAPYQASKGPDAIGLSVGATPQAVKGVTNELRLTATADDTRYDDDNLSTPEEIAEGRTLPEPDIVTGGRFSIDAPAWVEGTETYEMTAGDGAFDESIEQLVATIDVKALDLSIGRHTAFVQAQDATGNYGAPTAIFFDVLEAPENAKVTRATNQADTISTDRQNDLIYGRR